MNRFWLRRSGVVAAILVTALTACGTPTHIHTLDNAPDIAAISTTNSRALSTAQRDQVERSRAACTAIDAKARALLPDLEPFTLVDGQCQWTSRTGSSPGVPELIVTLFDRTGGGARTGADATFDETTRGIDDERTVAGVGDRATFDPQTATLYVVKHDRLWYLQLIGRTRGNVETSLTALGRALVQTPATR
jgi:hypothetical protein